MSAKKPLTPEERAKRLEMAKLAFALRNYREQIRKIKPLEAPMSFFTISKEEDKALEHMTVRALADQPERSHALFDTYGVFISNEYGAETKDFVVSESLSPSPIERSGLTYAEIGVEPFKDESEYL